MESQLSEALGILGVPADSDRERVTDAYRRLARVTHPDVSSAPDAAERFAMLAAAYRLVSASSVGSRNSGLVEASQSFSVHAPPRRSSDPGSLAGNWAISVGTCSGLLHVVSPCLVAEGSWGRPPIVAGPVIAQPAQSDARALRA